MQTVGNNIATLRKQRKWTQEELAIKVGYKSKSTINKIELGINDLPQNKIVRFAEIFGVTPSQLMGWNTDESPYKTYELTENEQDLLNLYRNTSDENKQKIIEILKIAIESN